MLIAAKTAARSTKTNIRSGTIDVANCGIRNEWYKHKEGYNSAIKITATVSKGIFRNHLPI